MEEVGKDGVITTEESKTFGLSKEIVKGLQFDRGYVSGYMVTNTEKMESVLEEPYILITDKKISSLQEILPLLEKLVKAGKKELVIIADDVDGIKIICIVSRRKIIADIVLVHLFNCLGMVEAEALSIAHQD